MHIRSVFNVDQSLPQDVDVPTTFTFTNGTLRVTRSPSSCIRHCCPADDVFFSSEKEFDLWGDVLRTATTNLWDGENVQLLLHGPAANMSLFHINNDGNSLSQTLPHNVPLPLGPPGGATAAAGSSGSGGALAKILRALLKETLHRCVPEHYSASVAVGACVMGSNGALRDISPAAATTAATAATMNDDGSSSGDGADVVLDRHGHRVEVTMMPIATASDITSFTNHVTAECGEMMQADIQNALRAAQGSGASSTTPQRSSRKAAIQSMESSVYSPATVESPSAGKATFDEQLERSAVSGSGSGGEDESGEEEGSMLLLSVQLRQWCSASPPKVSYLRITQIIHTPHVIEEALLSLSRNRPLPSFAANLSKTLVERVSGNGNGNGAGSQLVYVQSATPSTALDALSCLAAAKGAVVRAELAAVATDIVQASEQFLTDREALREKLRGIKEEVRKLRAETASKERYLAQQSTFGANGAAPSAHSAAPSNVVAFRPTGFASASDDAHSPSSALRHGGTHSSSSNHSSARNVKAGAQRRQQQKMDEEAEERANLAEEKLFQFQEFSEGQKRKVETFLESLQQQIAQNSAKCLHLRRSIEEINRRMITDQVDHDVALRELKQTLEDEYQRLLNNGQKASSSSSTILPPTTASSPQRHNHHQKPTGSIRPNSATASIPNTSRVMTARTTATTVSNLPDDDEDDDEGIPRKTQEGEQQQQPIVLSQAERLALHRAKLRPTARLVDRKAMNDALALQCAERTADLRTLQSGVLSDQTRDQDIEARCRAHCNTLLKYCQALQDVFLFVEKAAKKTHSFDPSMVPRFEDVELIADTNSLGRNDEE